MWCQLILDAFLLLNLSNCYFVAAIYVKIKCLVGTYSNGFTTFCTVLYSLNTHTSETKCLDLVHSKLILVDNAVYLDLSSDFS